MAYIKKANERIYIFVPIKIDKGEKYCIMTYSSQE